MQGTKFTAAGLSSTWHVQYPSSSTGSDSRDREPHFRKRTQNERIRETGSGFPCRKARALVVKDESPPNLATPNTTPFQKPQCNAPWRPREDTLEGKRRYPGGQEKIPWRAREDTLEGKRRYPGGQEKIPWRAREDTLEGKRRYPGGQEKIPCRAREVTLEAKRTYPGGQEKIPWRPREDTLEGKRSYPGGQEKIPWRAREDTQLGERRRGDQRKAYRIDQACLPILPRTAKTNKDKQSWRRMMNSECMRSVNAVVQHARHLPAQTTEIDIQRPLPYV